MQVLERLKVELNNKEYFSDENYIQFLSENDLTPIAEYDKPSHQRRLLLTCLDILEAVSNDTDIMSTIKTEFLTVGDCYKFIQQRIEKLKNKIATLPTDDDENEDSSFSLMFTSKRGRRH